MAVFTPVEIESLEAWLENYDLGKVIALQGIHSGIENSNFFLTTAGKRADAGDGVSCGEYVLTLFERLTAHQLPFYLELMRHLAERNVPCPAPVPTRGGALLDTLNGKPVAIVKRLPGRSISNPGPAHCAAVGSVLADLHLAGRDFAMYQPNLRGLSWWKETAPKVLPYLDDDGCSLLTSEIEYQTQALAGIESRIPGGPIHADLFRDNVLFEGTPKEPRIGGLIDFYFAGFDSWLFDIAICVNDWCIDFESGEIDADRARAMLGAYASSRPFTESERGLWNTLLRAAALRFWLSRLWDFHLPRPAEMLTPHDPAHFERILRLRRSNGGDTAALP